MKMIQLFIRKRSSKDHADQGLGPPPEPMLMEPLSSEKAELHIEGQLVRLEKAILGWCRKAHSALPSKRNSSFCSRM
jgi:hypothetical protein